MIALLNNSTNYSLLSPILHELGMQTGAQKQGLWNDPY
jgi:hypothetical protein